MENLEWAREVVHDGEGVISWLDTTVKEYQEDWLNSTRQVCCQYGLFIITCQEMHSFMNRRIEVYSTG